MYHTPRSCAHPFYSVLLGEINAIESFPASQLPTWLDQELNETLRVCRHSHSGLVQLK